ncbi:MAG: hypothetical protein U0T82_01105 [Bacteroidales bacterium]
MKKSILILFFTGCLILGSKAQNIDSNIIKSVGDLNRSMDLLSKIKISGLVQFQYQLADTAGIRSYAGGDFPGSSADRMMVRRGRFKVNYASGLTQYVAQLQITEAELTVREIYMVLSDPWKKSLSLTSGVFFRPFGYELDYSDAIRECPERTRLVQILFPGERDLGSMLQYAPEKGPMKFLRVKAGLFAGNGVAKETDRYKDLIGRLGFNIPVGKSPLTVSGGISGYYGKQMKDAAYNKEVATVAFDTSGNSYNTTILKKTGASYYSFDETTGKFTKRDSAKAVGVERQYLGLDLQLNYKISGLGNLSLRGEYISGLQPGIASSSRVYTAGSGDLYLRNFNGYYVWLVQDIGKKAQVYFKYDEYDPNIKVTGKDIGKSGSLTGAADMKYTTSGFGGAYSFNSNIKLSAWYELVKNERAPGLKGDYNRDLPDNVLTLRLQYKF